FPCRAGCLGGLVTNLRFQEEGNRMPRRSILSAAERESLLALPGSSQKTESMVTPVFATPILTTSWLA
ncbi:hypothetical protein N8Y15_25780, partial [Enterobacter hormaechei subsp. hoffmannii]|uniref:hypothetical protein n=1 Tax=Enterobacter asburiae TaxID=61645 RepID=UPI001D0FE37C